MNDEDNIFIADYGTCMITKFEETLVSGTINATIRFAPPELILNHLMSFKVILYNNYYYKYIF